MSIVSFNHNLLGAFSGVQVSQQVTQFRSIVYATYPERFRQSTVKTSYGDDERNFTEHGYVCPQVEPMDYSSTGGMIPGETPFRADEHKCLGLTITVPNSALEQQGSNSTTADEASKGLPVLIYIHGGAFERGNGAMGGGHEQKHNVETSVNDETPVIAVTLQ